MNTAVFRIKQEWRYHLSIWRLVIDWTIALYILIPTAAISGYYYWQFWQGDMDHLFLYISPLQSGVLLLFFVHSGTIRLLTLEGDLLFLRKYDNHYMKLRISGVLYSLLLTAAGISLSAVLLVPVWFVYGGLTVLHIILLLLLTAVLRLLIQGVKQWIAVRWEGWRLSLISLLVTVVFSVSFGILLWAPVQVLTAAVLFTASAGSWVIHCRLQEHWSFFEDCLRENQERLKFSAFFLQMGGFHNSGKKRPRKKPLLLFSESESFFRHPTNDQRLLEWFIKRWLRNKTQLFLYLQFLWLFSIAVTIAPFWIKWLLLLLCSGIVIHTTYQLWQETKTHPFYQLLSGKDTLVNSLPLQQAIGMITTPAIFLFGFFAGTSAFSAGIGLLTACSAAAAAYYLYTKGLLI